MSSSISFTCVGYLFAVTMNKHVLRTGI